MGEIAYRKVYRVRPYGRDGSYYEITVPKVILDKAARSKGMTIEEFIKTHKVVHLFNSFTGFNAAYRFEPDEESGQEVLELSEKEAEELGVSQETKPAGQLTKTHMSSSFDDLRKKIRRQR